MNLNGNFEKLDVAVKMFKPSKNARRLSKEEKIQYRNDGYLKGLPVFSYESEDDLNNLFVSLSTKLNKNIKTGEIISLGSITPLIWVNEPCSVKVSIDNLDQLRVNFIN